MGYENLTTTATSKSGLLTAQYQYAASWTEEEGWRGKLKPYGPLELLPSAQVLNYGQSIFEGMKVGTNVFDLRPGLAAGLG